MTFYEPSFLWALGLLLIPILIHLFNLRKYKRVTFSNVEMLKELHTQSRKTRQIKKWLVLLSRLLALAFLILAFARPFIPKTNIENGKSLVSIYLDNSQSMLAEGEDGQLFENGKNIARDILDMLPNDIDVQFLDNRLSPYINKVFAPEQAESLVDNLESDYFANDLKLVLERAKRVKQIEGYGAHHVFLISDFQKNKSELVVDFDSSSVLNAVKMMPVSSQNLSIDTAWIDAPIVKPGSPLKIYVKVTNNGDSDVESSTITLKVNEVQQGFESFGLVAQSSETFEMEISTTQAGWIEGEFSISDVPVVFDNSYFFSLLVKPSIQVLSIGESSKSLQKLFQKSQSFELTEAKAGEVNYSQLGTFDFIILNSLPSITSGLTEQLGQFLQSGGAVLVIPSARSDKYSEFSRTLGLPFYLSEENRNASISAENLNQSFIADVYKRVPKNVRLPKVFKSFEMQRSARSKVLLKLKDGSSILTSTPVGTGVVFQFAMPLSSDYSTIVDHEIFVLSMLKMAFSRNEQRYLAASVHSKEPIPIVTSDQSQQLYLDQGDNNIVLETAPNKNGTRVWLNDEVVEAGVFTLRNRSKNDVGRLALNYKRMESKQKFYSDEELENGLGEINIVSENFSELKSTVDQVSSGKSLWKLFLALSLLFLLIEVLLLRFLKT